MRLINLLLLAACLPVMGLAQDWTPITNQKSAYRANARTASARFFQTNPKALRAALNAVPGEQGQGLQKANEGFITIPNPAGDEVTFSIVSYAIAEAPLMAKFPEVRTYYGTNVDDPVQTIYLDLTANGFHAAVAGNGEEYYIDPVGGASLGVHQVYTGSDARAEETDLAKCMVEDMPARHASAMAGGANKAMANCSLLQFTMAVTATPQYSNFFGATSEADAAIVHSEVVTIVNRLNAIFTRDLSVRFQLPAENDRLYNYDPENSPFSRNSIQELSEENTAYTNSVIGEENYDLGHVLSQRDGIGIGLGQAAFEIPCGPIKGFCVSMGTDPATVPFLNTVFAHEVGHTFGANHKQNSNCFSFFLSSMEPGSGSTIMSYAGQDCFPEVEPFADGYFHGHSIFEMESGLANGIADCGEVIDQTFSNLESGFGFFLAVPTGTPFYLFSGAFSDRQERLTYQFDQIDPEAAPMPPLPTNEVGPMFRSVPATDYFIRYFPNLEDMVARNETPFEVLPTVERELNFACKIAENNGAFSCRENEFFTIQTVDTGSPFEVTEPSTNNQYSAGQTATIRWNVAGTDQAPISATAVFPILLFEGSTDEFFLGDAVPNTGEAEVVIPDFAAGTNGVIMLAGADGVFYNISPTPITIVDGEGTSRWEPVALDPTNFTDCEVDEAGSFTFEFSTASFGGASAPITWEIVNLPGFINADFAYPSTLPGGENQLTLSGLDGLLGAFYNFRLRGTSADGTQFVNLTYRSTPNFFTPFTVSPNFTTEDLTPTLAAAAPGFVEATSFDFQLSDDENFSNVIADTAGVAEPTYTVSTLLEEGRIYYWRVRMEYDCVISEWETDEFRTGGLFGGFPTFFQEAADQELSVFPNPTTGDITYVTTTDESQAYELTDLLGRQLETGMLTGKGTLQLSQRKPGVYLLHTGGRTVRIVRH